MLTLFPFLPVESIYTPNVTKKLVNTGRKDKLSRLIWRIAVEYGNMMYVRMLLWKRNCRKEEDKMAGKQYCATEEPDSNGRGFGHLHNAKRGLCGKL